MSRPPLRWIDIVRLGLVQTALGAVIILTTSAINRIMVVELALPAVVPGLLLGLHYGAQVLRPRWGFGADVTGRSTPWIIMGMAVLATGGFGAAVATVVMGESFGLGIALAVLSFIAIGIGAGAAGTSLLVLLARRVAAERRAAAATIVWVMMIAGFIVTAATAGYALDPYSPGRLLVVSGTVSVLAFLLAVIAVLGIEGPAGLNAATAATAASDASARPTFWAALRDVWREPEARAFTVFVFVSMLAYSAQDLILEPFAGIVFAYTPGQSTQLSAVQNGGVLTGMIAIGALSTLTGGRSLGSLGRWTILGCLASAVALAGLAIGAVVGPGWPLRENVFLLGLANGAYAVAAIGSMMMLAGNGTARREGTRMGVWGAAQGIAFGVGGLAGAAAVDLARLLTGSQVMAYMSVFGLEAALFLVSAVLASIVAHRRHGGTAPAGLTGEVRVTALGDNMMAGVAGTGKAG
jgi:BCD family chlorophyll transporter-like MFS transporter